MSDQMLTHSHPPSLVNDRAVEVIAMLGDSVVGVRHVTDPKGGVVKTATKALLATGAALLCTSAIAFGYAAHVAAKNDANLKAFLAKGKPAWAFRPEMLPNALDALTIGGAGLGLAALVWGLSRRKSEQNPSRVRLGTAPGVDFPLEGVGSSFDLVAPQGEGFVVAALDGTTQPISATTRLRLQVGATTFHVSSVPAPAKTATGIVFDRRPMAFIGASVLAHLGLVWLLSTVPAGMENASGDTDETVSATAMGDENSSETKPEQPQPGDTGGAVALNGKSSAMTQTEGQLGTDHPDNDPGNHKIMNRGPVSMTRSDVIAAAQIAGILSAEGPLSGGFAAVTGSRDIQSGMDDADIYSWTGPGDGSIAGFGDGRRGIGPGGGGDDPNSFTAGNYHTIGEIPGGGDPFSTGPEGPLTRTHKHIGSVPILDMCRGDDCDSGDGDPSIVRQYMKRNAAKIAFCYEKELLANPGLAGTVATHFTVLPNGHVVDSSANGVNSTVSSCVADVIARIQFPLFKVPFQVKYPFYMHSARTA